MYICGGAVTINGGTFAGIGEARAFVPTSSGYSPTGEAIVVDSREGYAKPLTVNIKGGMFSSQNNRTVGSYPVGQETKEFIKGGYFSTKPEAAYIASNYVVAVSGITEYPYEVKLSSLPGSGTQENPYQVASASDLNIMGAMLNPAPAEKKYFKLANDITASQENVVEFVDYWGDKMDAVVPFFYNSEFDGNGKTITFNEPNNSFVFGEIGDSKVKDLTVNFVSGTDASVIYHGRQNNILENVVTKGEMLWNSGNYGIFYSYFRAPMTMTNCVNKANMQTVTGDATMYCAVFTGYGMSQGQVTMTNCTNEGSLTAGKAGFIIANWSYQADISFVLTNCKNNGQIRALDSYSEYHDYNYVSALFQDKHASVKFTIDDIQYTSSTTPKWYEINAQGGVVGTGTFINGPSDPALALKKNPDNTFTITPPSSVTAAYYVVSVGIYCGTSTGSSRRYATEKITSGTTTTLKYLSFVDDAWIEANPTAVKGTLAGNTIYTLGGVDYYYVGGPDLSVGGTPGAPQMVSVSAFDANNVLLASAPLTE